MAADLAIHVFADGELTDEDFACAFSNLLGSIYYNPVSLDEETEEYKQRERKVHDTECVFVGKVSFLKAALFEDEETFVPDPVAKVSELIDEDFPYITDEFISQIAEALQLENKTGYSLTDQSEVIEFLEQHKGKRCFTIAW